MAEFPAWLFSVFMMTRVKQNTGLPHTGYGPVSRQNFSVLLRVQMLRDKYLLSADYRRQVNTQVRLILFTCICEKSRKLNVSMMDYFLQI